jgi:hypothetical protein
VPFFGFKTIHDAFRLSCGEPTGMEEEKAEVAEIIELTTEQQKLHTSSNHARIFYSRCSFLPFAAEVGGSPSCTVELVCSIYESFA